MYQCYWKRYPILILINIQQLAPWFNNDLDDNIALTIADTRYNNDLISLQWVKYLEKYAAKREQGERYLLLMESNRSHQIY